MFSIITAELKKAVVGAKISNKGGKKERKCNIFPFINILHFISFFSSPTLLM